MLPGSTLLTFSSVLSRCKAVLFNLRVPSLTKSDLCKDARVFHKLNRFQLLNQYRAVSKVATSYELVQSGLTEMTKVHRQEGAGGASPFVHFSSFPEMNWEEREAARAERNAAATEAQTERKTAAAEQRRLMVDVFELKPYLEEGRGRRSGFARGEPWTAGSRERPKVPLKVLYRAVLLLEATVSPTQVEQRLGLKVGYMSSLCGGWEAILLQALHVLKRQRVTDTVTAELCRFKRKMVRTKSNRSNISPCLMVRKLSFQLGSRIFSAWPSFTAGSGFSQRCSQCSSCRRNDNHRCSTGGLSRDNVQRHFIAWNILSRAISRITETVILYATFPHQLRGGVR